MKRFLTCFLIILVCSCTKTIESPIPYARVNLKLDLRYEDKDLKGAYFHKEFTSARNAGESVGYSGVLVVCGFENIYYAYDLCCPHEASQKIRVVANDIGQAVCPECGTVYDTGYGSGSPVEGVSKYPLRRYTISPYGDELVIQF
jgi:nitrite reductase/ring-hydroxylating ferredoxin subunit